MRGTWPAEQPTLTDGVVLLRPWRPEDAEAVFRACQDPDVQHFTQVPVPYLLDHAVGFVADAPRQWAEGTGAQFAVSDPATGQLLGCMGLLGADRDRGRIGAGYWTAPWARSRGLTRRALRLATGWALTDGGFDVVVLEVELDNPRSMAVVRSVGYVPGDAPIDSWELKGSVRHFVGLQITRSELEARAGAAGARLAAQPPARDNMISQLRALEPLGHRSPPGSTRAHFEDLLGDGFWEVGASGRVYDRTWCLDELADRYADPTYDPLLGMSVDQFEARPLGNDVWLVTYRLFEDERETRRLTVWRREAERWAAQYHQGTLVPSSGGPVASR
jgi:RimJ/RimL family protein N-acetyltransferase